MNVFVLVWFDKHIDHEVEVHANRDSAIAAAREVVNEWHHPGCIQEQLDDDLEPAQRKAGWIYHCTYDIEECAYIYVVETEVLTA